nr:MAG TPA_asm: Major capsid protein [Microviridae sp.]
MKVNIGKNTLGDNNKMSVSLREYGRSTHDLSYAWRSPMGVGTLVPFMKILALPGDTFDIDLDTKVLTHPTVGPLFGQFKMQLDVFTCPLRLYQAQLHNNALNIGLDMKKVKLPKFAQNYKTLEGKDIKESKKSGKGSLAEYLGLKYEPMGRTKVGNVNAVPYFGYYDVFKNYYANKQEEYFMIMGGGKIITQGTITTEATALYKTDNGGAYINRKNAQGETAGLPVKFTISKDLWEASKKENTVTLYYNEDSIDNIAITINAITSYVEKEEESGENVIVTCRNKTKLVFPNKTVTSGTHTLAGKEWIASQGVWIPNYTSSYKLEEIDNLREYILKQGKKEILIESTSKEEWLGTSFIKDVLVGTAPEGTNEPKTKMPIIQMEMGGLCLKTLQSDIFNNWVNKEWVDGDNGIKAITDVAITDGKLNLDSLNIAQKVYNMLNRIAVSGGSYKDWIETVYTTDYYFRAETPVYEGGMSTIIDFEAVVSNSASTASGIEEPLGSLAGRGYNGQKKGGRIKIKVNEPCYIMGIASITPLVDYSQGNDWDNWLETMDDLHKPQLDGIGYQDLMENKMHGLAKPSLAVGKQPAWLDYMTNFNKTYADFAAGEEESYMVLNRIYNVNDNGEITNATTYINPKDYTYIFATNTETNRDFWVQIGCGVTARRVMSAAQIPLM